MDLETNQLIHQLPRGSYVLAVSGGVDSVVLLDLLVQLSAKTASHKLIVAHFDHGIRSDSAEDAEFVSGLAAKYGLPFETRREELGKSASEELARARRYQFLQEVAANYRAKIVTAHHANDAVETVAINLRRGTGWRGLAILDSSVIRPMVSFSKAEIIDYAKQHQLAWHEDSTNASDNYLRNRLRRQLKALGEDEYRQILALRDHQIELKRAIDAEVSQLVGVGPDYSRYFLTHINQTVALECLRHLTAGHLTRPQLERALLAVKTAKSGSIYQAGDGVEFCFTSRNFTIKLIK